MLRPALCRVLALLLAVVVVVAVVGGVYCWLYYGRQRVVVKVFSAGSLAVPLSGVARVFEGRYGVRVDFEFSGSVMAVRKVTDFGKVADVVAVADYELIPGFMVPRYADWYVAFATNEVVIAFTSKSKYVDEVLRDPSRVFEVLGREGVRFGFSNPNYDPCGYRAVGVIALASLYYNDSSIVDKLIVGLTNIRVRCFGNGTVHVYVPSNLEVRSSKLVIRDKSVDLVKLLEAGELDYAFEYLSVAKQHNLLYVRLPKQISLGDPTYASFYARVTVHILVGTDEEKAIRMKPIVYGITVPKNAPHKDLAIKFVELLLSDEGRQIFERCGQPFLPKPLGYGNVPEELRKYVTIVPHSS